MLRAPRDGGHFMPFQQNVMLGHGIVGVPKLAVLGILT